MPGARWPEPDVGRRLAAARMQRGLSQGTVARLAGVAPSYVSRIERGKVHPTVRTLLRIVMAAHLPFEAIVGGEPLERRRHGACPLSASGTCVVDLIRSETEVAASARDTELFTPAQVDLLRRIAVWLRGLAPHQQRAVEVFVGELLRPEGVHPAEPVVRKRT